jgi:hypothetical protein
MTILTFGCMDRVLMELDGTQQELAQALNLTDLAPRLRPDSPSEQD